MRHSVGSNASSNAGERMGSTRPPSVATPLVWTDTGTRFIVASVAASFRLFGVGVWQARLVGLLYTYGAFLLLYHLADRLYGRKTAMAALILVILFPLKWQIHPLIVGRQVLGGLFH